MTITVTKEMLREKNACDLFEFTNRFGDSIELTVENLKIAYEYGLNVEWFFKKFPELIKKLNRSEVIEISPEIACCYADYVDRGPSDDTRKASCDDSFNAYWYALFIDKGPRDDTRKAVLDDSKIAYLYAYCIDKCARDDTRKAVSKNAYWKNEYINYFGK